MTLLERIRVILAGQGICISIRPDPDTALLHAIGTGNGKHVTFPWDGAFMANVDDNERAEQVADSIANAMLAAP